MDTLLTTEEVAEVLRMTPAGLRNLIYRGRPGDAPPFIVVRRRRLFPASQLKEWLASKLQVGRRSRGRPRNG